MRLVHSYLLKAGLGYKVFYFGKQGTYVGFLAGTWANRRQRILEQLESRENLVVQALVGKGFI